MKLGYLGIIVAGALLSSTAFAADLKVSCYKGSRIKSGQVPLVSFSVADTESMRLVSELQEVRSSTDSETIPSFAVSQYKFQPLEIFLETDDAGPEGRQIAHLHAYRKGGWWWWDKRKRKKQRGEATYHGHYKRLDVGREFSSDVVCVVNE